MPARCKAQARAEVVRNLAPDPVALLVPFRVLMAPVPAHRLEGHKVVVLRSAVHLKVAPGRYKAQVQVRAAARSREPGLCRARDRSKAAPRSKEPVPFRAPVRSSVPAHCRARDHCWARVHCLAPVRCWGPALYRARVRSLAPVRCKARRR